MKYAKAALADYNKTIELEHSLGFTYANRGYLKINFLSDRDGGCVDVKKGISLGNDTKQASDFVQKYCNEF